MQFPFVNINPQYVTAIGTGLIGYSIPKVLDAVQELRRYPRVSDRLRNMLSGTWGGQGNDWYVENGGPFQPFDATFELKFKPVTHRLYGNLHVRWHSKDKSGSLPNHVVLEINGTADDNGVIQLQYRSTNPARRQLGVMILQFDDTGNKITGHYSGYSAIRQSYIAGRLELAKES